MVPDFSRTTRALTADRGSAGVGVGVALALLALWGGWLAFGEVTLYESAASARVSVQGVARLRAPVAAEVVDAPVALGDAVAAGQLLVQLDDAELRLQLSAARSRVEGLRQQLAAMETTGSAEAAGREAEGLASAASLSAARAELEEARVRAEESRLALARVDALIAAGAASAAERDAARTELAAREARVRAAQEALGRYAGLLRQALMQGEASASREVEARYAAEADLAIAEAEVLRLERAVEERAVRAPIAGVVGERAALVPGQRVAADAPLVVVVPDNPLEVLARFPPERAVGRVQPGQSARVRVIGGGGALGARRAEVARVGSEPGADGLVAAELALVGAQEGLRHGLVAEVEVEVERLSPASLLVRAAGQASGAGGP
ncbi:MAG: HlyD family efflux transporter periplasmic adaptor subunit [Alphaproteobacteria bacterium]|nr:HlyD family efflux transporter periplasmic adaptor subunit [Alphaproteobacteria bacterium]